MPTLIIDRIEIEVPEGTRVIDAAERLGIMIPRFCYHPGLGSVGACRVCAVKFLEGPVKGVEMSCMVNAEDGMVVSTTDEEATAFRKYVIECLMLNHPHDCPVCDEGGHCLLQDETISGGHGHRRYLGKKRTYRDQYLGPFVQHEMNRCIHCFRCRRFYQEFAGYRDLGALQIGNRMYFGRFCDGPLESPFSGNLIDICPTGVFTDKPARYKGRRWDFERAPSLCLHCSLGCSTTMSARYREMVRQESRLNEAVNGHFICDRGRFGFDYANHVDRPSVARIGHREVPWDEALQSASKELNRIVETVGPGAIACLGSLRSSLETQGVLKRLCRVMGWPDPCYFIEPSMEAKVKRAVSRLDGRLAVSMKEIEEADFILGVGADPMNEAPMLALAMRQAYRNGGTIAMIDPRPISLPFEFDHIAVAVREFNLCLDVITKGALSRSDAERLGPEALGFFDALPGRYAADALLQDRLMGLSHRLRQSEKPVIICGTDIVRENTPDLAADHAMLLQGLKAETGLFYLLPGPNAFGAALLSSSEATSEQLLENLENSAVKALILVETDPLHDFPDRKRLLEALDRLDLLLVLDYLPSPSVERAHIVFPTLTVFERVASGFMNQEGRIQFALPGCEGGLPVRQIAGGNHPPRTFMSTVPGGEPKPAGEILCDLASVLSANGEQMLAEDIRTWLAEEHPLFRPVRSREDKAGNIRLVLEKHQESPFIARDKSDGEEGASADDFEVLMIDWTFGTEELSRYSEYLRQVEKTPQVMMHPGDISRLGLPSQGKIILHLPGGSLTAELSAVENMAAGVVIVPRHRELPWQKVESYPAFISGQSIEKV